MYKIYADDICIYNDKSPMEKLRLIQPKLTLEDNSAGSLEFTLPPENPGYDTIKRLTTVITVYKDKEEIWSGRVLNESTDFYNCRKIYCEGELAYLNDTIQTPEEFVGLSIQELMIQILSKHNARVSEKQRFEIDSSYVWPDKDGTNISCTTNYETTMKFLQTKILDVYGGHFIIRKENGKRYLDYYQELPNTNSQRIEFGKNLLDYTKEIKMDSFCTVLIPLGETISASEYTENTEYEYGDYCVHNGFVYRRTVLKGYVDTDNGSHWYLSGEPTLENEPASTWNENNLLANHVGDLYKDKDTNYVYRFDKKSNDEYAWTLLRDEIISEKLNSEALHNNVTDGNFKIFFQYNRPESFEESVDYISKISEGDLWYKNESEKDDGTIVRELYRYTNGNWSKLENWNDSTYDRDKELMTLIRRDYMLTTPNFTPNVKGFCVTSWFYNGVPTNYNSPAKDWDTVTIRKEHVGDFYYNYKTNYVYQYTQNDNDCYWRLLPDLEIGQQLTDTTFNEEHWELVQLYYSSITPQLTIAELDDYQKTYHDDKFDDNGNKLVWTNKLGIYIENKDLIEQYGYIVGTKSWSNITTAKELYDKGVEYAKASLVENIKLELKAIDLHSFNVDVEALHLLDKVNVVSEIHGLPANTYLPITKIEMDLDNPESSSYTIGETQKSNSLSASTNQNNNEIEYSIDKVAKADGLLLKLAKANATHLMKLGSNGYVTIVQGEHGTSEIIISDTDDYKTASRLWRWNVNGLGYSKTGYDGEYGLAMTMDGAIVADYITTGYLSTERLKGRIKASDDVVIDWGSIDNTDGDGQHYYLTQDFINFKSVLDGNLGDLQEQIDNEIVTWYDSGNPIKNTRPAWPSSEDKSHVGDLYYNRTFNQTTNRYDYNSTFRFEVTQRTNTSVTYGWVAVTDDATMTALKNASLAADTADGKRRIIRYTGDTPPSGPYDDGDMCSNGKTILIWSNVQNGWVASNEYVNINQVLNGLDENGNLFNKIRGTVITKNWIETQNIVAGSVAAENITGKKISGKTLISDNYADRVSYPYYYENAYYNYPYFWTSDTSYDLIASYVITLEENYTGPVYVEFKNWNWQKSSTEGKMYYPSDPDAICVCTARNGVVTITVASWNVFERAYLDGLDKTKVQNIPSNTQMFQFRGLILNNINSHSGLNNIDFFEAEDVYRIWSPTPITSVKVSSGQNGTGNSSPLLAIEPTHETRTSRGVKFSTGVDGEDAEFTTRNMKLSNDGLRFFIDWNGTNSDECKDVERSRLLFNEYGLQYLKYHSTSVSSLGEEVYCEIDPSVINPGLNMKDFGYFRGSGIKNIAAYEKKGLSSPLPLYVSKDGIISASSSSRRFKHDISEDISEFNPEGLYSLPVVQFKYNEDHCEDQTPRLGFIAEDVAEHFPSAARYDDGLVSTYDPTDLIPAMVKLIQQQNERLLYLENKIKELEGTD